MRLRLKIFLITGGVLGALFLGISVLLSNHLSADFAKLEHNEALKNINRLEDVFNEREDELSTKLIDWSQWDDMYQFAQDRNQAFIDSNFPNETFVNLHVNFAIVINKDDAVVYEKFVDNAGNEQSFPAGLDSSIAQGSPLVTFSGVSDGKQGVIVTSDGKPMVVAAQPITSSDRTAPPNGVVIFGYYFDNDAASLLSRLTSTSVAFAPYENGVALDDFSQARGNLSQASPLFIESPSRQANIIYGYGMVRDVLGKPALILRSGTDRSIFNKGQETIRLFLEIMLGIAILFIGIVFMLFEFLVIRKISLLGGEIKKIRAGGSQQACLAVRGKDEFAQLGNELNSMLETLNATDARKLEYIKDIERMNNLMVSRELKMVELKKEIAKLKNKPHV